MLYKAKDIANWNVSASTKDGGYIPCRPESLWGLRTCLRRLKIAIGVLVGKYDALDWEEHRTGMPVQQKNVPCDKATPGWYCSRQKGHDGPCAAHPIRKQSNT